MANLPALTPKTFDEAMRFAETLAKSTMVPREYQRMPANILVAIQWGAELGLGPLQALQNIAVINGKPSVYGDAMLALVRGSPLCEDVIEHIEGEGDNAVAICEARRKGSAPVTARFSATDARRAGLWDKAGPWKQYPTRMLQMRARGFALRDAFPDVLRGVISAEEAADTPVPMKDVTPILDTFAAADPEPADDDLLVVARRQALEGRAAFRDWYMQLDDDQRLELRPHIKELQDAARRVEEIVEAETETGADASPQAPASPREVPLTTPEPPEGDPLADNIESIEVVKVKRLGEGWDWSRYVDDLLDVAYRWPPADMSRLRTVNASLIEAMRVASRPAWQRLNQALADYERDGVIS